MTDLVQTQPITLKVSTVTPLADGAWQTIYREPALPEDHEPLIAVSIIDHGPPPTPDQHITITITREDT